LAASRPRPRYKLLDERSNVFEKMRLTRIAWLAKPAELVKK
jgi:hypothetical protein